MRSRSPLCLARAERRRGVRVDIDVVRAEPLRRPDRSARPRARGRRRRATPAWRRGRPHPRPGARSPGGRLPGQEVAEPRRRSPSSFSCSLRLHHRDDQPRLERRRVALDRPRNARAAGRRHDAVLVDGAGTPSPRSAARRAAAGRAGSTSSSKLQPVARHAEVLVDPRADPERTALRGLVALHARLPARDLVRVQQPREHRVRRGRGRRPCSRSAAPRQPPAGLGPRRLRSGTTWAGAGVPSASASRRSSSATRGGEQPARHRRRGRAGAPSPRPALRAGGPRRGPDGRGRRPRSSSGARRG